MSGLVRYPSPLQGPQGLAWDGQSMWLTSAANGRLYALDPKTWNIRREFVPPHESLGVTFTGSDFRLILAPAIDEPDLERDQRYVYSFTPDAGFTACFPCPGFSGSFLAYANGTLYLSQAWDKKLIELDDGGAPVREVQLERRPVGMTIVDRASIWRLLTKIGSTVSSSGSASMPRRHRSKRCNRFRLNRVASPMTASGFGPPIATAMLSCRLHYR